MSKIRILHLYILSILIVWSICDQRMNIQDMIRRQEEEKERKYGLLPPNFVMFTFYKDKVNEIDRFSRILKEFLSTIGITASMVNSEDRQLIATIPRGTTFDKNIILDNFKDIIEKVDIADFTKP